MRAYIIVTGLLFLAIAVAHVFEVIERSNLFGSDVLIVLLATALASWAGLLARKRA